MRKLTSALTIGLLAAATMAAIPMMASAEIQMPNSAGFAQALKNSSPIAQPIACGGHTGVHGCGPGWTWHNGYNGWACYRC